MPIISYVIRGTVRALDTTGDNSHPIVALEADDEDVVHVRLRDPWDETATYLTPGMELSVINPEEAKGQDDFLNAVAPPGDESRPTEYPPFDEQKSDAATNEYLVDDGGAVVVEPDFLVDVTDIREWVQCPREYYISKLQRADLAEPLVVGTIVHEVFGDLLRDRDLETAVEDRVRKASLDIGFLEVDQSTITSTVREHAQAIQGWLEQGTLTEADEWRSEQLLISDTYGLKGRADAVRRGQPVELKTGKNTRRDPRFPDKIQATCYGLMLRERGRNVDTGTLLYTKNAILDRDESGDLSPAKEFSIGDGLIHHAITTRNAIAAMEHDLGVPSGEEADAKCKYCFVKDTCKVIAGRLEQESKAGAIGRALPPEEQRYFDGFYAAIEAERRSIHDKYRKLWEQSRAERAKSDDALLGLEPTGTKTLSGGRYELAARRPGSSVSRLREGDFVLVSDGDPIYGDAEFARIETLTPDRVVVSADEPVELRRIDSYPSEVTADRLVQGVHDGILLGDPWLKDLLTGDRNPDWVDVDETFVSNNADQNRAIQRALGAQDCALIHGPPGTGKTYTIARTVRALVERGERVLLSAFTNRAVDNAIEALREQGFEGVLRMGSATGIREDMMDLRLDDYGNPDAMRAQLEEAPVVATTASGCGSTTLRELSFDVAVVDEASQLTEPGTLLPITLAERFVLVGDHHQLPPVVRSTDGNGAQTVDHEEYPEHPVPADGTPDLSRSLFERLIDCYPNAATTLTKQYRMAQRIQAFSSREFYGGRLRPATGTIAGQSLADLEDVDITGLRADLDNRVSFYHVVGSDHGRVDPIEAQTVADIVQQYLNAGLKPAQIGVIAPYRAQVAEIGTHVPKAVAVDTVDRFQGSSKEVIVISFVATGNLEGPIFEDHRRINVALTRAKRALVLVGDRGALTSEPRYERMIEWATANQ